MSKLFNVSGLTQVFQKGISPFSATRRNLDLEGRWAMACWGNRIAARNTQLAMPAWTRLGRA